MKKDKSVWRTISENWERIVFSVVGLLLIGYSLRLIYLDRITNAGVVFGLGFLSFIYANISRFKRFKGLGFEAELWEDKKKEAEDLIGRLKNVVSIYTREVILSKVTAGRLGNGTDWRTNWDLYDELVNQHDVLGQKIDLSHVKKIVDDYFLFDMSRPIINAIRTAINAGKAKAMKKIETEFGNPIRDVNGYSKRLEIYRAIEGNIENKFAISTKNNLADHALMVWNTAKKQLKRDFDVDVELDSEKQDRLGKISALYENRPVSVTDELIAWANRQD